MEDRAACGPAVDLWPPHAPPPLATLQHLLDACAGEPCVALHHGRAFAPRLVAAPAPAPRLHSAVDAARTAVVSGGTKGLGLQFAKQIAAAGQGTLVLASRNPRLSKSELVALAAAGAAAFVVKCDAGSGAANARLERWVREWLPAVQTYAHAAGALGYDAIPDITTDAFHRVTRPKVQAAAIRPISQSRCPVEEVLTNLPLC